MIDTWLNEQNKLKEKLNAKNIKLDEIKTVMGLDSAYWETNRIQQGCCAYQIFSYENGEILEEGIVSSTINIEYIPSFLYYREHILMDKVLKEAKIKPNIIVCDGNGILHPRNMGEATQFGITNNIPTIGIAKNLYKFEELIEDDLYLYYENKIVGKKIWLNKKSSKCQYISVGYKISLDDSITIVKHMQQYSKHNTKYSIITKGCDHIARKYQKEYIEKFGGIKL